MQEINNRSIIAAGNNVLVLQFRDKTEICDRTEGIQSLW